MYFTYIPLLLNNLFENDLFKNSKYIIEIITVFVLAIGFFIHMGVTVALRRNYSLIAVGLGFKESITFYGGLIFLGIILSILNYYYNQQYLFIIVLLFIGLLIAFGYFLAEGSIVQPIKNARVTLKMIVHETSGNTRLKIIHNLELYQTTDKDYRFKATSGNEFIIPI